MWPAWAPCHSGIERSMAGSHEPAVNWVGAGEGGGGYPRGVPQPPLPRRRTVTSSCSYSFCCSSRCTHLIHSPCAFAALAAALGGGSLLGRRLGWERVMVTPLAITPSTRCKCCNPTGMLSAPIRSCRRRPYHWPLRPSWLQPSCPPWPLLAAPCPLPFAVHWHVPARCAAPPPWLTPWQRQVPAQQEG